MTRRSRGSIHRQDVSPRSVGLAGRLRTSRQPRMESGRPCVALGSRTSTRARTRRRPSNRPYGAVFVPPSTVSPFGREHYSSAAATSTGSRSIGSIPATSASVAQCTSARTRTTRSPPAWGPSGSVTAPITLSPRSVQAGCHVIGRASVAGPGALAVGAGKVWVTDQIDNQLWYLVPAALNVPQPPVAVGNQPVGVAFGDGFVWVTNYGDGTVYKIDPTTKAIVKRIKVGRHVSSIAVGPGKVWVVVPPALPSPS